MGIRCYVLCALVLTLQASYIEGCPNEVQLPHGFIHGSIIDKLPGTGNSIVKFSGIPYAHQPILDGEKKSDEASQRDCFFYRDLQSLSDEMSSADDCLYLDVYVNEFANKLSKPVLVIFGDSKSGNLYSDVAEHDSIILVKITGYRRGSYEESASNSRRKNLSVLDMATALTWVQLNIAKFGGNNNEITVAAIDKEASLYVSMLERENQYGSLFRRIFIAYGEENIFQQTGILKTRELKDEVKSSFHEVVIGYDWARICDSSKPSSNGYTELLFSEGNRLTLFSRPDLDSSITKISSWYRLCGKFTHARKILEDEFPRFSLQSGSTGINVLILSTNHNWEAITVTESFLSSNVQGKMSLDDRVTEEFPIINTTLGPIRGHHLHRGPYEADAFFHIPYASPTARFDYSKIVEPWTDLYDARYPVRYKDCPQRIGFLYGREDCLNLHIFVPGTLNETLNGSPLPVMVFMHGGSNAFGSAGGFRIPPIDNSLYDGTILANIGPVVVVSLNYRLGALGFLNDDLDNGVLSGNYGIRDIVLALDWVQQYIGEYGGDPNSVTIFGESAGSSGVGVISLSPMAEGLFHRVIQESGSSLSFFAVDDNPGLIAEDAITQLGCRSENGSAVLDCLNQRDMFDFVDIETPPTHVAVPWRPTIDGIFLDDYPANLLLNRSSKFDLLLGTNYDETFIMMAALVPSMMSSDSNMTVEEMDLVRKEISAIAVPYPDRQQYAADIIIHSGLDWTMDLSSTVPVEINLVRSSSDFAFAAPAIQQALLHSQYGSGKSTYMYDFHVKGLTRVLPEWVTNFHTMELPYVFGEGLRQNESDPLYGDAADELSLQMMTYWTNFARTGDPNQPNNNSIDGIDWAQFNSSSQNYMKLDFNMSADNLMKDYKPYEIALWNDLMPKLYEQDEQALLECSIRSKTKRQRKRNFERKKPFTGENIQKEFHDTEEDEFAISGDGSNCNLSEELVRNTTNGCIRGNLTSYNGIGVEEYLGIPYAEPPIDELRLASPVNFTSNWDGVYNATAYRPDCPRTTDLNGQDEDCLYLNVFLPNDVTGGVNLLPVMVWIHSDLNSGSGGEIYDGKRISALGNVIVVTFNYRIGALGFLSTGDVNAPGNFGLLDQNMALTWVRENIAQFGGDATAVTLFGDRDSSEVVGYHTLSPMTGNLFVNVIHQSGVGQLDANLPLGSLDEVVNITMNLECNADTNSEMISCIRNHTLADIMNAAETFEASIVVDGIFLPDQPNILALDATLGRYRYLIGFTSGEGSPEYSNIDSVSDRQTFQEFIANKVVFPGEFVNAPRIQAVVEYEYLDPTMNSVKGDLAEKLQASSLSMHGDRYVVAPSMLLANKTSEANADTFIYQLVSAADDSMYPEWMGAPQGSIEELIWWRNNTDETSIERMLADKMVMYWTSFASGRAPTGTTQFDTWNAYDRNGWKYTELDKNENSAVTKSYLRPKFVTLWNRLIPSIDISFPCDVPSPPGTPEVQLSFTNGDVTLRGYADTTSDGRNFDVFHGLPYALPPTGERRFQQSEFQNSLQVPGGGNVYEASMEKPRCLQTVYGARGGFADEDCLYLDIWRPSANRITPRSVMLWICNGGYSVPGPHSHTEDDASCDVDGKLFALDGDIVFVRVHYRVGVLGFLSPGYDNPIGNAGLSDVKNALKWVYANIGSFGGSSDKVTVAGNGLGGVLALIVAGSSIPGGIIQGVIAQSASLTSPWAYTVHPEDDIMEVAVRVGCEKESMSEIIACLKTTDALQLITSAGNVESHFPFAIYAQSQSGSKKTQISDELMRRKVDNVAMQDIREQLLTVNLLNGFNGGDGYQFTLEAYPDIRKLFGRRPLRSSFITSLVENDIYLDNLEIIRDEKEKQFLTDLYIPWGLTDDGNEIRRSAVHYHTDEGFLVPIHDEIIQRLSVSNGGSTYFYIYQQQTNRRSSKRWLTAGADFGEEIPVMFEENTGDPILSSLGQNMRNYWTSFVANGEPISEQTLPWMGRWPAYNDVNKAVMSFNSSLMKVVEGYRDNSVAAWNDALPNIIVETPTTVPDCATVKPEPTTSKTPTTPTIVCPEVPLLGSGIGLSLTPSEADAAIEALFGISLAFACILLVLVGCIIYMCNSNKKNCNDSLVMSNGNSHENDYKISPEKETELSAL